MDRLAHRLFVAALVVTAGTLGCADLVPTAPLVTGERGITSIATDDFFVYWTTGDGAVKKISVDGGAVTVLVPPPAQPAAAEHVTLDDDTVYFTLGGSAVMKAPKKGGESALILEEGGIRGIAVDTESVYWSVSEGKLGKAPKKGGTAETLATGQSEPSPPVIHTDALFWAIGTGELRTMLVAGGAPETLVAGAAKPHSLAVTSTNLYWTTLGDSSNGQVNVADAGGDKARVVAEGQALLDEVAGDADAVYWTNAKGTVSMAPLAGGEPSALGSPPARGAMLTVPLAFVQ